MTQYDTLILSYGLNEYQQKVINQTISPDFVHVVCDNVFEKLFDIPHISDGDFKISFCGRAK